MRIKWIVVVWCLLAYWISVFCAKGYTLEGQSKGSTNWIGQNLQNWQELDYIPVRVKLTGGPVSNQVSVVSFDHSKGTTPGLQNLINFVPSSNVVLKSAVLSAPIGSDIWSYTFTVDLKDSNTGTIQFVTRLSAGAHLFVGSSLSLQSPTLQVHKPGPAPGSPDLMVQKIGPAHAPIGSTINYTVYYTNITSPFNTAATGIQISDQLPSWVTYVPGSASAGGTFAGNILTWDLNGLAVGGGGSVTYQVVVSTNAIIGQTFQNWARIFSAENDADFSNNESKVITIVDPALNAAPSAINDNYTNYEDTVLTIAAPGVLANDTDVDGNPLRANLLTLPSHGAVTLNTNGSFVYTPVSNYFGSDSFTYNVSDGTTNSSAATVNITVLPVNDPPVALADNYSMDEDTPLSIAAPGVLGNDSDIDSDLLSAVVKTQPSHGTLSLSSNGSFNYAPAANFNGIDNFTYVANDGVTNSGIATVTITVYPRNDAPVAADDNFSIDEDTRLVVSAAGVLTNDFDVDGDALSAIVVGLPTHGSLTLNTNGSFIYIPATNFNGADSFTYRATDGMTNSAIATVNIVITPVNDAPVAVDDHYVTEEDLVLNVPATGVLSNDSDVDGDALAAVLVSPPAHGVLTLNTNGSLVYAPATNYHGTDSFTYQASDGVTNSALATVTITVNSVNDAPVAVSDSYNTDEDTTLNVAVPGVLSNDLDVDGDSLTAMVVTGPIHGSLSLSTNGSFVYTPVANYNGTDSFTYRASDGLTNSGIATVTITVAPVNDAPVALDDNYATLEDVALSVSAAGVLTNDTDVDGNILRAILVTAPSHGALSLSTNGAFVYTPSTNYHGTDAFTYRANDGLTNSGVATVTITVTSVNDRPVAVNDSYNTDEDTTLTIAAPGVLGNDSDADGDPLSAIVVTSPAHGTLTLSTNGAFVYTPTANFNGTDTFTYRASDGLTNSGITTVTIVVASVNDAPVAFDDNYTTPEDVILSVPASGVLTNDTDVDGDVLRAILVTPPTHGTLTLSTNGSFVYLPSTNYHGTDTFTYRANDGATNSGVATVTISVTSVNDRPVAVDDSYNTDEDTTLTVVSPGVLANDSDVDADPLSAVLVATTTHGTLILNTDGSFVYTPALNYNGTDSFTYRASDGLTNSGIATVTISVGAVNDPPVAGNDSYTIPEDTVLSVTALGVLTNDTDLDGNSLTAILVTSPTHGTLSLNTNGSFVYKPATNFYGTDSFTYKANDGITNSAIATVTITVTSVNDRPIALNDNYSTDEDTPLNVTVPGVLANDSDVDGDSLSAILVTSPTHGTLTLNANGSFLYTPTPNYNGTDGFTYRAFDGLTNSGIATVTISIGAVNDPPVAVNDSYTTAEDTVLTVSAFGVLTNDTDLDGNTLSAIVVTPPTNGTLLFNTNGSFVYTPATNYHGTDTFTYEASDGITNSGIATVTITVTSVNDRPVALNDNYSTDEDSALNVAVPGVIANDSDVDGDPLTAILVTSTTHGTLTLSTNGAFLYTPATNYNGTDSFTYRASDGLTNSGIATVTILIGAVNDPPVAVNDNYTTPEDIVLTVSGFGVLTNDSDLDGNSLSAILVTPPTNGTLSFNTNGSFVYTPATNYHGIDVFTYRAWDGATNSAVATVTITVTSVNDRPVAVNDTYSTDEDVALNVGAPGVLQNDTDADGDLLTALIVNSPTHGTVSLSTNGSFIYNPAVNFHGTDSFTYKASDGLTNSAPATVTITVLSINDPPVAVNDNYSTDEDTSLTVPIPGVLANDTDLDGDVLQASVLSPPAHGTLTLNANGSFVYTPDLNFNGSDSFTYRGSDGITNSSAATVSIAINAKNDPPTFSTIGSYTVNEDAGSQTIPNYATSVSAGADNELGQVLTFTVTNNNAALFSSQPALTSAGTLTFTPAPDAFGGAIVTAVLKDNGGTNNGGLDTSIPHVFTITVNPVNDPPSFTKGSDQLINQGATNQLIANWATGISVGPANESAQVFSFILTNDNPSLFQNQPQISSTGTLTYLPKPGTNGVAHVSAVIQDNGGTNNGGVDVSVPQEFIITINGPPVAKIITPTNGSVIIASTPLTVLCNATDPDGTVTNLALFCNGSLVSNLTQPYLCSLPNLTPGNYQLTATATDNLGLTGNATPVNFTVIDQAPLTILVAMHFNPQTGLFEQTVQISNPTPSTFSSVRIYARNLTNGATLYNISGSSNGVPYAQYNYSIPAGQSGSMIMEYYVPSRISPNPVLSAEVVPPAPGVSLTGAQMKIDRATMLSDGNLLLDFQTATNRNYYIQYSCDLKSWETVTPCVTGTGSHMQWLDNGPPKTSAKPCNRPFCVYRVLLMP